MVWNRLKLFTEELYDAFIENCLDHIEQRKIISVQKDCILSNASENMLL